MAGLIYKEFMVNRKMILSIIAVVVIMSFAIIFMPSSSPVLDGVSIALPFCLFLGIDFVLVGEAVQNGTFDADERKKWADYIISSPMTDKGQVFSKYCFSMVCSAVLILWSIFLDAVINAVYNVTISGITQMAIVIFFSLTTLARSIEFPFYIRFGKKYGDKLRSFLGMFLLFIAIVYMLFGDLSIFALDKLKEFFTFLLFPSPEAEMPVAAQILMGVIYLLPAVSMIAYYVSYRISVKLYKKGAECFDK